MRRAAWALAGVLAAAPLAAQEERDEAFVARYAQVLAMADARRLDADVLEPLLRAGVEPALRRAAVRAIGQVRADAWRPRLIALLTDPDTGVAADAAFALALAGALAPVVAETPALLRGPGGAAIAQALTVSRDSGTATAVRRLLADAAREGRSPEPALLIALGGAPAGPVEVALPFLRDDDAAVRWAATYAVTRTPQPAAVRALAALAVDPPPAPRRGAGAPRGAPSDVRAFVARGLPAAAAGDSLRAVALQALARLARDPHPHVRINAARALATYGADARDLLLALARDGDANVRVAVGQAVTGAVISDLAGWTALFAADTGLAFRTAVVVAAAGAGVRLAAMDTARPGTSWGVARDWRLRRAAVSAVAALGWSAFAGPGRGALRDPDPRVRVAAVQALARFADSATARDTARSALRAMLDDDDPAVLAAVLGALARPGGAEPSELGVWWPRLREVLTRDGREAAPPAGQAHGRNAQRAAIRLIAALWARDSGAVPAAVRAAVRSLPPPASPGVRAAATGHPPFAAWEAHGPVAVEPAVDYAGVVRALVLPALAGRPVTVTLRTTRGTIGLELFAAEAPLTVHNFVTLARRGYFDGQVCHRVVPNFVVQCGDPTGAGDGGPGWAIRDELHRVPYDRGTLGMALSGPDTGGSQWFLTHAPQPHLDGGYTVFGRVRAGWAVRDALVQGDRLLRVDVPRQF